MLKTMRRAFFNIQIRNFKSNNLGIFLTVFLRAAKRVAKEPVLMVFMACIAAYFGHNIFCYQQCVCTPIIFILMGITEMINRSIDTEKGAAE